MPVSVMFDSNIWEIVVDEEKRSQSDGFRFTHLPRIGSPMLKIPDRYWATDEKYSMGEGQKRSFECVGFIESLGSGKAALMNKLAPGNGGVVQRSALDQEITDKKYAKFFAEWVDGDALAANHGYGIDYFCTNDSGSSAGNYSIFYPANLMALQANYPVNVISPIELVTKFEAAVS